MTKDSTALNEDGFSDSLGSLSDLLGADSPLRTTASHPTPIETATAQGKPLEVPITQVMPDPDQPRKHISEASIASIGRSIKDKGVKSPISVKPKNPQGKYLINHGERRYRGSLWAGKQTIPVFIDDSHDDYDQMIENIEREDLQPMDIAHWCQKKLDQGHKKKTIAQRLNKPATYVTYHLALLELSDHVLALYDNDIINVERTLYFLSKADALDTQATQSYCNEITESQGITVKQAEAFLKFLQTPAPTPKENPIPSPAPNRAGEGNTHNPKNKNTKTISTNTNNTDQPIILLKHGKRTATLLLERRAETGQLWAKYPDGEEATINIKDVALEAIIHDEHK